MVNEVQLHIQQKVKNQQDLFIHLSFKLELKQKAKLQNLMSNDYCKYLPVVSIKGRDAPKVMSPILLCSPTISQADVSGMTVVAKPSCKYSITFCCCVARRGAV